MGRRVDPDKTQIAWDPETESYWTVEDRVETGKIAGVEVSVSIAEHIDRVVWVDEAPDDQEDGSGHFEVYTGDEAEYKPRAAAGKE